MILIIREDGSMEQQRGDLSQEQMADISNGGSVAIKYDHIAVTFRVAEVSYEEEEEEEVEEGGGSPEVKTIYDVEWLPVDGSSR